MVASTPRWFGRRGKVLLGSALAASVVLAGALWFSQPRTSDEPEVATGTEQFADLPVATPSPEATGSEPADPAASAPPAPDPGAQAPDPTPVQELEVVELPAVEISAPADFGNQVSARLSQVTRVDGVGQGMGERSGPSLLITVEITNGSADVVDLDYVVVNLYDAGGAPGQTLFGDARSAPYSGTLAPGETRSGSYVLRLPDPEAATVTVSVSYGAQTPTAIFTGDVGT